MNRIRWWIIALLFLATVLNYVDRQTLSILSHTLREELGLTDADYSNIVSAFLFSYIIMYAVSGRLIDRYGVRLGVTVCVAWWSIATMLTAFARGAFSLAAYRFLLGIGEPGIFPAGVKACGEWFPKKMRALPTGIFSSGSAVGAIIAAPLVVWITIQFGWRAAFVIPGALGLIWIPIWWMVYRTPAQHPALTSDERRMLEAESPPRERKPWHKLLMQRKVWALVLPRVASDPVWYFYLFWLPEYFQKIRHLSLVEIGIYGWIPFLFADLGCIFGGAASDWLVRRGWTGARARVATLCTLAILAPFGALVGFMESTAAAISITCLITFICQAWSTNIATLAADVSDREETGSVMGLMGSAGGIGGILFAQFLGWMIAGFGYSSAFIIAAVMHPIAAVVLFALLRPWLTKAGQTESISKPHSM